MAKQPTPPKGLHPVVEIATRALKRGETERYHLDDEGARAIEAMIVAHKRDPLLSEALLALFGMVRVLDETERSPAAARAMLMAIGRVQAELTAFRPEVGELVSELTSQAKDAVQKLSGAAPVGAVSVRSLPIKPLPFPRPPPRKR